VYSNSEYFVAQIAGTTTKINQIISEFVSLGVIMEIGRSGEVAMLK
jgi:acetolactate synthase small subunit